MLECQLGQPWRDAAIRVCTTLVQDRDLLPNTHIAGLTTACKLQMHLYVYTNKSQSFSLSHIDTFKKEKKKNKRPQQELPPTLSAATRPTHPAAPWEGPWF